MPSEEENPQLIRVIGDIVDEAAKANQNGVATTTPPVKKPQRAEMRSGSDGPGTFYLYVDGQGHEHIVDSRDLVPKKYRQGAKRWVMPSRNESIATKVSDGFDDFGKTMQKVGKTRAPEPADTEQSSLHIPSLLIGVVLGAVLFVGSFILRGRTSFLIKAVLTAVVAAIISIAYFGWVRQQAGLGHGTLAKPDAVLEDARRAAELLDTHHKNQQKMLEELEKKPETLVFP